MSGNTNSGRISKSTKPKKSTSELFTMKKPRNMSGEAAKYWYRNIKYLISNSMIKNKDYDAFCRLCNLYQRYIRCQDIINEDGETYETETDRGSLRYIKRPESELSLQLSKQILDLERKFGLNPVDGKQVKGNKSAKKSVRDQY